MARGIRGPGELADEVFGYLTACHNNLIPLCAETGEKERKPYRPHEVLGRSAQETSELVSQSISFFSRMEGAEWPKPAGGEVVPGVRPLDRFRFKRLCRQRPQHSRGSNYNVARRSQELVYHVPRPHDFVPPGTHFIFRECAVRSSVLLSVAYAFISAGHDQKQRARERSRRRSLYCYILHPCRVM